MPPPRLCDRPGCGAPAATSLVFQYAARTVWLHDLGDPDPAVMELCELHAGRVTVPLGWVGHDRRTRPEAPGKLAAVPPIAS